MEPMIGLHAEHRQTYRLYDVCIVFPYKVHALIRYGDTEDNTTLPEPTKSELDTMKRWEEERDKCLTSLKTAGLMVSAFYSRDRDEVFVKIGVDGTKLAELAEQSRYPLQMREQYHGAYADFRRDTPGTKDAGFRDRKVMSSLYAQHPPPDAYEDHTTIFRSVDRIRLIDYCIRSNDKGCAGIELGELQYNGYIKQYFPLTEPHQVRELEEFSVEAFIIGTQIDKVRDYCGEKVAFYFQWQAFLNSWLIVGCLFSVLLPLLPDLIDQTPNNKVTPWFCVVVVFWLCAFITAWKRKTVNCALRWGTLQKAEEVEFARPEFHGTKMVSSLTGRPEIQYPFKERLFKMIQSYAVLAVVMAIMFFGILFIFAVRHMFHSSFPFWGRVIFMFVLAVVVEVANLIFVKLAMRLNNRENWRTDREYETNLLAKTFCFKAMTTYGPLIYILFFKQNSHLFYFVQTDCMGGDCMVDMSCQLAMFFFVKLVFGNFVEWVWPILYTAWISYREHRDLRALSSAGRQVIDMSSAERQAKRDKFDMFENMDEVVCNYGLTVIFWVACPWAPFAMLGSNIIECWGDANKMLRGCKRPFPTRSKDNEPWDTVFTLVTHIAVITNIATVVFADTALQLTMPEKILGFFLLQHVYFLIQIALSTAFPSMPETVKNLVLKQNIIVKKATEGTMDEAAFTTPLGTVGSMEMTDQVLDRDDDDEDEGLVTDACSIL
jgi:hypothetical protein